MASASQLQIASDFMKIDNDLSSNSLYKNFKQALVETGVIFALFTIVILGRSLTNKKFIKVFQKAEIWTWIVIFLFVCTILKTYYPKFDDQLLNAAIFSIVYTLMVPLKID
jgi:hypothetical protein